MTVQEVPGDGQYRPWVRWVRRHTRWLQPAFTQAGHYSLWVAVPWAAVVLTSDSLGRPGWIAWLTDTVLAAWFASVLADRSFHYGRLCEQCAKTAPLDPDAAIRRWRPALRRDHRKWFMFSTLAAASVWAITLNTLLVTGVHYLGLPAHRTAWAYLLQDVPAVLIIGGYYAVRRVHANLFPWCPWCNWGRGGDGPPELVPDPDPEDHGVQV